MNFPHSLLSKLKRIAVGPRSARLREPEAVQAPVVPVDTVSQQKSNELLVQLVTHLDKVDRHAYKPGLDRIRELLASGADANYRTPETGDLLAIIARDEPQNNDARHHSADIVRLLLEAGLNPLRNSSKSTSIERLLLARNTPAADTILDFCLEREFQGEGLRDDNDNNVLHCLILRSPWTTRNLMKEGRFHPNWIAQSNKDGNAPLHCLWADLKHQAKKIATLAAAGEQARTLNYMEAAIETTDHMLAGGAKLTDKGGRGKPLIDLIRTTGASSTLPSEAREALMAWTSNIEQGLLDESTPPARAADNRRTQRL